MVEASHTFVPRAGCVEAFVTHNGDLDYYSINGVEYSLGELQALLPAVLHQRSHSATPPPASTAHCH